MKYHCVVSADVSMIARKVPRSSAPFQAAKANARHSPQACRLSGGGPSKKIEPRTSAIRGRTGGRKARKTIDQSSTELFGPTSLWMGGASSGLSVQTAPM